MKREKSVYDGVTHQSCFRENSPYPILIEIVNLKYKIKVWRA